MTSYLSHEGWRKENKPIFFFPHSGALIKKRNGGAVKTSLLAPWDSRRLLAERCEAFKCT